MVDIEEVVRTLRSVDVPTLVPETPGTSGSKDRIVTLVVDPEEAVRPIEETRTETVSSAPLSTSSSLVCLRVLELVRELSLTDPNLGPG